MNEITNEKESQKSKEFQLPKKIKLKGWKKIMLGFNDRSFSGGSIIFHPVKSLLFPRSLTIAHSYNSEIADTAFYREQARDILCRKL